jgi:hypothetical protein
MLFRDGLQVGAEPFGKRASVRNGEHGPTERAKRRFNCVQSGAIIRPVCFESSTKHARAKFEFFIAYPLTAHLREKRLCQRMSLLRNCYL